MNSIVMWLFSQTSVGKLVDGKKTVIGATFIVLGKLLEGLNLVLPMFPQVAWLASFTAGLSAFCEQAAPILDHLGLVAISAGLIHKQAKVNA